VIASLDDIRSELVAFADEPDEVLIESDGKALFTHAGQEIDCRFVVTPEGAVNVQVNGRTIPYRQFLVRQLGHLDVLAERIVARRHGLEAFIDGPARLDSVSAGQSDGRALELLDGQCSGGSPFMASVTFITADAGQGKTALLRKYQAQQAEKFLAGSSPFVFWHVDLQGRQLLRLSEALLGDLGELRVSGLWMPAILSLMRHRALVLAIDGFDELAAEQGSTDALGALASLVREMRGQGRVIAASRRTFFDTEDYLRRAGLVRRAVADPCEFNQISLLDWARAEDVDYLALTDPELDDSVVEATYRDILDAAGGDTHHPILTRPFLFTHVVMGLRTYGISAEDFLGGTVDGEGGVERVISAFVKREVEVKWRFRDTGDPYLTFDQHMRLLATIAEHMYEAQRDRLDIGVIETLAAVLCDEWGIDPTRRAQIAEMVRMHVLLVIPADGDGSVRAFDHPEFREYFIAWALKQHLADVSEGKSAARLSRFLSIAQISDATARYVSGMLQRDPDRAARLVEGLASAVNQEKRLTFLQVNVGTLIPYLIDGVQFPRPIAIDAPVVFSSLVFEGSRLSNVSITNAMLLNASISRAHWRGVRLVRCRLVGVTIDTNSDFQDVAFEDCEVDELRVATDGDIQHRDYAPERIAARLKELGLLLPKAQPAIVTPPPETSYFHKTVQRVLRLFYRTTTLQQTTIEMRFASDASYVIERVMPFLEESGIVEERTWKGGGQQHIWTIRTSVDRLFASEEGGGDVSLAKFWERVRKEHS